ncbi:MAG: helix-turn-helix domain-containing protein [Halobacteriales archaeon]
MSLYQASFRLRHECPYRELSGRFPNLTIREWYLSDCQLLEITAPDASQDALLEEIDKLGTILHRSADESGLHVVTKACLCPVENSIIDRFEEHNCLYQPPTIHRQGWEQYSLIAFDETDIQALHADLESDREVDVLSKTGLKESEIPHSLLTPIDQLFGELTDRQLAALQLALEKGYYNQPRQCSTSELAEQTTVARATFEEHLRKAENKLIDNAGQFIRLLSESQSGDTLRKEPSPPISTHV